MADGASPAIESTAAHASEPVPEHATVPTAEHATAPTTARTTGAFSSLRAALARPSAWSAIWVAECVLALAPALAYFTWLAPELEHRTAPREHFRELSTVFRFDQRAALGQLDASIGQLGALLGLLAMFVGAFAAGGWLTLFLADARTRGFGAFVAGGVRFFGRFARLIVVTGLLLALVTWLCKGAPWNEVVLRGIAGVPPRDFERLETLSSESTALLLRQAQACVYALGVALVLVWGDFTRTRLALFDTRSVVWAGLESACFIVRHPVRALRPVCLLFVLEAAIVFAFGALSRSIDGRIADGIDVATLLVIGQFALAWRIVLRGARYHAVVAVSRALVTPHAKPDPWRWGRLPLGSAPNASPREVHAPVAS